MFNPYEEFSILIIEKNPQKVFKHLIENDKDFIKFVLNNKAKSLEDIALEYDIDINILDKLQLNI